MANAPRFPVVSPLGRIVEGDPWTPQEKDGDGNLRVYKSGPNVGQPNPQYYIGLAVPKWVPDPRNPAQMIENPDFAGFYGFVDAIARKSWPNLFPNGGPCVAADFSWKIRDGDGVVRKGKNAGKSLAERPGFAGHWIIAFASSFAPQIVVETAPGVYAEITDRELVKRGYYVRIGASVSSNESTNTPGLYVNLEKIELKGKGEVIHTGVSAAETFRGAAQSSYVPQGMQALTAADLATAPAGFGGAPAGGGAPAALPGGAPMAQPPAAFPGGAPAPAPFAGSPAAPAPGQSPVAGFAPGATGYPSSPLGVGATPSPAAGSFAPGSAPAGFPAPGAVAGYPNAAPGAVVGAAPGGAPAGAPAAMAPSAPSAPAYSGFMPGQQKVMLPAAGGATYEQFVAQGWTDEAMISAGYMAIQ